MFVQVFIGITIYMLKDKCLKALFQGEVFVEHIFYI
jgi:hypothetical protein